MKIDVEDVRAGDWVKVPPVRGTWTWLVCHGRVRVVRGDWVLVECSYGRKFNAKWRGLKKDLVAAWRLEATQPIVLG